MFNARDQVMQQGSLPNPHICFFYIESMYALVVFLFWETKGFCDGNLAQWRTKDYPEWPCVGCANDLRGRVVT